MKLNEGVLVFAGLRAFPADAATAARETWTAERTWAAMRKAIEPALEACARWAFTAVSCALLDAAVDPQYMRRLRVEPGTVLPTPQPILFGQY